MGKWKRDKCRSVREENGVVFEMGGVMRKICWNTAIFYSRFSNRHAQNDICNCVQCCLIKCLQFFYVTTWKWKDVPVSLIKLLNSSFPSTLCWNVCVYLCAVCSLWNVATYSYVYSCLFGIQSMGSPEIWKGSHAGRKINSAGCELNAPHRPCTASSAAIAIGVVATVATVPVNDKDNLLTTQLRL